MAQKEWRAVFSSPSGCDGSVGPSRGSLRQAAADTPKNPAETQQYLSGIEIREVTPWCPVPLKDIVELSK